ncbi:MULTISPECIES: iron ABC transporter substrate-binding protein [unclassified Haematobacter]|uniref:iron ABC transporter substrate-binding protein n=1 Tax=unclassified Haematobacter TaxID=2640585 RepID=UPI0025BD6319|nr:MULTISPECIES: iron ABC transporter substrate-binding protein [unclassified Haematobacter]
MRYFSAASLIGAALAALIALPAAALDGRTVTDATGREVMVPVQPERVFAAGPPAATLLYTLKPEAMVGWVRAPKKGDLPFLRPEVAALPELGRLTGRGDTLNLEVLLAARPDLIFDYGTVNGIYKDLAARVQDQAGVPYILIDGSFARLPQSIRQLGDVLAVPERAETLAAYAERAFADLDGLLAEIPEDHRPSVYLARGPEGLETAVRGSINAEIIERVGGRNVASGETGNLAIVSPEQVQAWAPEVIITIDPGFAAKVGTMPEWRGVPAVAKGRVYLAPAQPFGFIDTPPSVNRLIGLKWLAQKLYPDRATGDLHAEVADFYRLFYGVTPDDAAVSALLGE